MPHQIHTETITLSQKIEKFNKSTKISSNMSNPKNKCTENSIIFETNKPKDANEARYFSSYTSQKKVDEDPAFFKPFPL